MKRHLQLSECLESVDSPEGHRRLAAFLRSQPFPHYVPDPIRPDLLVRIEADGQRTTGRIIDRQFRPAKSSARRA